MYVFQAKLINPCQHPKGTKKTTTKNHSLIKTEYFFNNAMHMNYTNNISTYIYVAIITAHGILTLSLI